MEAIYTNFALITHSPSELILDLARALPNAPKAKVYARVVMTPMNAKLLHKALVDCPVLKAAIIGHLRINTRFSGAPFVQRFRFNTHKGAE